MLEAKKTPSDYGMVHDTPFETSKVYLELCSFNPYSEQYIYTLVLTNVWMPIQNELVRTRKGAAFSVASTRAMGADTIAAKLNAGPLAFGAKGKQMKAADILQGWRSRVVLWLWLLLRFVVLQTASLLKALGVHKEYYNQLKRPFLGQDIVVTITKEAFDHLYDLRNIRTGAMREFAFLVEQMREVIEAADEEPCNVLSRGNAHIPFLTEEERLVWLEGSKAGQWSQLPFMLSAARAARVSYGRVPNNKTPQEDWELGLRLMAEKHAVPFEHCVMPVYGADRNLRFGASRNTFGNYYLTARELLCEGRKSKNYQIQRE